jgi:hypothetical protein
MGEIFLQPLILKEINGDSSKRLLIKIYLKLFLWNNIDFTATGSE